MPPAALLRRSGMSIHKLHWLSSIQRFHIRQLSSFYNDPQLSSSSSHASQINNHRSILRWITTGIAVGSTFGASYYYWSSNNDDVSSIFDFFRSKGFVAFADCSSTAAVDSSFFSFPNKESKFLLGDAFRRKIFFNYEKRIRSRSPPEKVFEYFASVQNSQGEVLMTPADLMRAVVPVFPPSGSNIVREGSLRGERHHGELRCAPSKFFMLFDVDNDGLISFKEYIFFVTLLSIPESSFSVAFKMFDVDNNGKIEREEFKKVMALMRSQNRQGASHCDGLRAGIRVGGSVENGGLVGYFFGKDGEACLHLEKFVQFLRDLHDEILRLEFAHYDHEGRKSMSAKDFALSMVASADIRHISKLLDRVDEIDDDSELSNLYISEDEFRSFAELRKKLLPFSLALFSYGKVNGLLTRTDFQRAASSKVCGVPLSDNVVSIVFHVFDTNRDGSLSTDEFVRVLEKREKDIGNPVSDGILGCLSSVWSCASNSSSPRFLS